MSAQLRSPHHRAPRRTLRLAGLAAVAVLTVGCGATGESPAAEAAPAVWSDTATLSAQSVAIGGFTFDTARLVPWRSVVTVLHPCTT